MSSFDFAKLFAAVRFGDEKEVRQYLEIVSQQNLDINQYDQNQQTKYWNRTALSFAVENNFMAIAKLLLAAKADPETRDRSKQTSLHYAAWRDYADMTRLLLAHKASVASVDWSGMTPLHTAAANNSTAVVDLLIVSRLLSLASRQFDRQY